MAKWTVEEINAGDGVHTGWYLRGRSTQRWFSVAEGWNREDVQLLADRRNAREAKPRFTVTHTNNGVWSVGTTADFYGINAEQHAEDFANKLNKECGQ